MKLKQIGIYKITNIITKQVYIGQSTNIFKRWGSEIYDSDHENTAFYNSLLCQNIRQYGIDNFEVEIIENCEEEELNDREQYWIKYYDSIYPNGLNSNQGGNVYHNLQCVMYDVEGNEQKVFYSNKEIIDYLFTEGSVKTSYRYEIIKNIRFACNGERHIVWGHLWSYLGQPLPDNDVSKVVYQLNPDTGEIINEWVSCGNAASEIGCTVSTLARCCRGESQTCLGKYFCYKENYNEWLNNFNNNKNLIDLNRKIYALKDGQIVATFNTCADAAYFVSEGKHRKSSAISRVCAGERKSAYGYEFVYKENYHKPN